jgi:hypothetical protein
MDIGGSIHQIRAQYTDTTARRPATMPTARDESRMAVITADTASTAEPMLS